ncbi:MAG: hypothetical protein WC809_04115 [Sinimarinibacterium sp.]|jgi:hypothetical protein
MHTLKHFDGARKVAGPQDRVENVRAAALEFRKSMLAGAKLRYYESFDLVKVPYPSYYGLRNAFSREHWVQYVNMINRVFVCQFDTPEGLKTLLISPSDYERNRATPFFKRLSDKNPKLIERLVFKPFNTVESVLNKIGLRPEDVDYITYDHLHTQDVRRWLGSADTPGYFPNAKLIVHRQEWESALRLTPIQRDWYCPGGIEGIPEDRVIFVEGDVMLGAGVAMIHTPGHTEGNHSMVVHTDEGLWVTSENGICAEAFAPERSAIPGVADYARATGVEVILNGNTLENSIDQYISMVQEKTIAGPSQRNPDYPNVFPSSELTANPLFPGAKPTFAVKHARHGELQKR